MTDLTIDYRRVPILEADVQKAFDDSLSYYGHQLRDKASRARLWFWLAMVFLTIIGALAASIAFMLPLKQLVPLYLSVHDDGTADEVGFREELSPEKRDKMLISSVWRYVQEREGYTYMDAKWRYDFVDLMTCGDEKRDYDQWFLRSSDSPQKTIGKNGKMWVEEISNLPVRNGVRAIRYTRHIEKTGQAEQKTTGTATVEYETLDRIPKNLFLGGDTAGICVTHYMTEE